MTARRLPRSCWLLVAVQVLCLAGFLTVDVVDQFNHVIDWVLTVPLVAEAFVCAFYNARILKRLRGRS